MSVRTLSVYAVSVIIPTYNRSHILSMTLSSLALQDFDMSRVEVIVVDDGSSDNTREITESFIPKLQIKYYYQPDEGYRVASARNLGIRKASAELLLFVDSGMLLHSNYIAEHVRLQQQAPDHIVIGYMFGLGQAGELAENMDLSDLDGSMDRFIEQGAYLDIRESDYRTCNDLLQELPAPWVLFWTGNISLKKSLLVKTGLFDEHFNQRWGMEDIDLGYRLFAGGNVAFVLGRYAMSVHYPHEGDAQQKIKEELVNKQYFHQKHECPYSGLLLETSTDQLNMAIKNMKYQSEGIIRMANK